jgi:MFS family permease
MLSPTSDAMTANERRVGAALASIFGLRMLGLFLILPVFSVHARDLPGGDNIALVGLALGAYGLTQMLLQIPFGMASDRFGRKPVIVIGLLMFVAGSVIAAMAESLEWILVGRVVQGAGAISGAVSALAADLTREQHRTKVMAMIGSSIGLMFAISLVAAPALYAYIGLSGIFWLTAALALAAIGVLHSVVPQNLVLTPGPRVPLREVLTDVNLLRLNFGIFTLHLTQMAMFVVLPQLLVSSGDLPVTEHWKIYLPAVLVSFAIMVPAIVIGERRNKVKQIFVGAVLLLLLTEAVFAFGTDSFAILAGALVSFFVAFNILEATLPSLISRVAPPQAKGTALGVYNSTQALGLFLGGALGGWLAKMQGPATVFIVTGALVAIWLLLAMRMPALPVRNATVAAPTA